MLKNHPSVAMLDNAAKGLALIAGLMPFSIPLETQ